jgi:hypothetical protein
MKASKPGWFGTGLFRRREAGRSSLKKFGEAWARHLTHEVQRALGVSPEALYREIGRKRSKYLQQASRSVAVQKIVSV